MSQTQTVTLRQNPFNGIREELRKVAWPNRAETIRLTSVVIGISLIIGLYVGIIDILLAKLLGLLAK